MKKIILIFILSFTSNIFCQDSSVTRVIYKVSKPIIEKSNDNNISPNVKFFLKERNEAYDMIECELIYNKTKSLFKIIDKLNYKEDKFYGLVSILASGKYYKDIDKRVKKQQLEIQVETLNISLPFEEYKWEIHKENKIINGYLCYKATSKHIEFNHKKNQYVINYPEVWFSPSISSSFGPRGLDGLPGLVLEGKFSNHISFYAIKITFEINDIKIEEPKNGKDLTQQEFSSFLKKINDARLLLSKD